MKAYAVYLISKSGSLLYQKSFNEGSPISAQTSNDYLVIAGNIHGIHTIASKLTPKCIDRGQVISKLHSAGIDANLESNRSGLRSVYTENFALHVHQTVTGLKLVVVCNVAESEDEVARVQRGLYRCYCEYVMKNPFYNMDMPVRIPRFDTAVVDLVG